VIYVGLSASVDSWPPGVPSQVKDLKQHVSNPLSEVMMAAKVTGSGNGECTEV
jgi:hypothetical protein